MTFGNVLSGNNFDPVETSGWGSGTVESAVPAVEEKPAEDDGWGFTFGSKGKKGKKAVHATPIEDSVPEPASEPAKEDEAWGWGTTTTSKKKEGKTYAEEDPPLPPPPEPELEPESVNEEPVVDLFKGLRKSQKKKLAAKMKKEAEAQAKEEEEQEKKDEEGAERKEEIAECIKEEEEAATSAAAELLKQDDGWGDDWGMATRTKKKKKKGKKSKGEPTPPSPPPELEPIVKEDEVDDQAGDGWGATITKNAEKGAVAAPKPELIAVPENEPIVEERNDDDCGNWASTTTSSKKKKAKKRAVEEPMPPTSPPPPLSPPVIPEHDEPEPEKDKNEDNDWVFSSIWSGRSKKKKKGKNTGLGPLPEPEPEPVVVAPIQEFDGVKELKAGDEVEWGAPSWGKKKSKMSSKYTPVDVIEEAPTAVVQKPDEDDPWGRASLKLGRKTNKKGNKESDLVLPSLSTPSDAINLLEDVELPPPKAIEAPLPGEEKKEDEDMWGLAPISKKRTKDEPTKSQAKKKNFSGLALELRKYFKAEEVVCPNQAEHFRGAQMWKNCSLCQSFLSQIADQIASSYYPSGYIWI